LGEKPNPWMNVAKGLVSVLAWALIAFGISYTGFGIFNDLNWGAPWACPGPFYTATNVLECLTATTYLVEIPLGLGILAAGIILLLVDKMVIQKK
jgi:hypothetical protein